MNQVKICENALHPETQQLTLLTDTHESLWLSPRTPTFLLKPCPTLQPHKLNHKKFIYQRRYNEEFSDLPWKQKKPDVETPWSTSLRHTSEKSATKIRRGKRYTNLNTPRPHAKQDVRKPLGGGEGHWAHFLSLVTRCEPCLLSDSSPSPLLRSARVVRVDVQLSAMLFYELEYLRLVPWFDKGGITKSTEKEKEHTLKKRCENSYPFLVIFRQPDQNFQYSTSWAFNQPFNCHIASATDTSQPEENASLSFLPPLGNVNRRPAVKHEGQGDRRYQLDHPGRCVLPGNQPNQRRWHRRGRPTRSLG